MRRIFFQMLPFELMQIAPFPRPVYANLCSRKRQKLHRNDMAFIYVLYTIYMRQSDCVE